MSIAPSVQNERAPFSHHFQLRPRKSLGNQRVLKNFRESHFPNITLRDPTNRIYSPENHMSYSVHILRQTPDGQDTPISQDEWNAFIDSDPDLQRPEAGHINFSETTALLPTYGVSSSDWQCLRWVAGGILSDYPQQPMLKKMGQIARHFGAVVISDDGDVWTIDEHGRVSMEGY